jgi:hypothetical protein
MKWRKGTEKQPPANTLVHIRYFVNGREFKTTGFYEGGEWYRQTGSVMDDCPDIEYLDEAPDEPLPTEAELQAEARERYPGPPIDSTDQLMISMQRDGWVAGASQYAGRVRSAGIWKPVTKPEDCPPDDSDDDFPKEYIVRGKGDDPRSGWVAVKYLTAGEMWEWASGFEYAEYLEPNTNKPSLNK